MKQFSIKIKTPGGRFLLVHEILTFENKEAAKTEANRMADEAFVKFTKLFDPSGTRADLKISIISL